MIIDYESFAPAVKFFARETGMPEDEVAIGLIPERTDRCYWCDSLAIKISWMMTDGPILFEAYNTCTRCGRVI